MDPLVVFLVVLNTALLVWVATFQHRRGTPPSGDIAPSSDASSPTRAMEVQQRRPMLDASRAAALDDRAEHPLASESAVIQSAFGTAELTPAPNDTRVRTLGVLSTTANQALTHAPATQHLLSGDLYRMVYKPAGNFIERGGGSFMGTARDSAGHFDQAHWSKASNAAIGLTAVASLATIAAGAYWQQQVDRKLDKLVQGVTGVASRLNTMLEAELRLADVTLREHEAVVHDGRYEPPASVTDGLRAALVDYLEIEKVSHRAHDLEGTLSHRDFVDQVLHTPQGEHLAHKLSRAAFGITLELRVIRLKWAGGLGESPAYLAAVQEQFYELMDRAETLRGVGRLVRRIESDDPSQYWKRLPPSREKNERAAELALEGRQAIGDLVGELTPILELAAPRHDVSEIEVLLGRAGDRLLIMAEDASA